MSMNNFQYHVGEWAKEEIPNVEKHQTLPMFLGTAIGAVYTLGLKKEDVLQVVDYVFSHLPAEDPRAQVGGTMVMLAVLCEAHDFNMMACGKFELDKALLELKENAS
jgi:queuine/archaeosine tRNA-ribosyltransferase